MSCFTKMTTSLSGVRVLAAVLGIAFLLGGSQARAQGPFTVQQIINNGNSQQYGDKIFSNFSVSVNTSVGNVVVPTASGITVNFLGFTGGNTVSLGFDFNAQAIASNGGFSSGDFTLRFHVHTLGAPIVSTVLRGVSAGTTAIGAGSLASARIDESTNPVGSGGISYSQLNGILLSPGGTISYSPGVTDIDVTKDVNFVALAAVGGAAIVTISAFDQDFVQSNNFVPEPSSIAMLSIGCVGLCGFGLRYRRKS